MQRIIDFLSCPNCGNPYTCGQPCNLTCRRQWGQKEAREHQSKARPAKHDRMRGLVQGLCRFAPEPIALDFLGD
jgi:hypothetical protein